MGVINLLERHIAELIAAGEVVERPASIVKEVVENAIDAGATAITVEIKNGGMTFIRVTDNGSGIYRDDVKNAFLSHATSKICTADDLDGIVTMGFRGEALASIAAVAKVELLTRREEELEGTRYVIEGSVERENSPAGCPKGTTIIIRDLFYNTPARLKFIKKDSSEANAVAGVLDKIAVSYPEISFKLIKDGELKLNTPGDCKLLSAVYAVFGREFAKGLTELHYKNGALSIDGLVSKTEHSRANRSMQNFFINKRFVKSRTCSAALEEAYKGAIMVGKFPACILNLTIEPHTVDVNVHPAKIEVRFENEKMIFDLVYFGVKNALAALKAPEITAIPKPAPIDYSPQQEFIQQRMIAQQYHAMMQSQAEKNWKNTTNRPVSHSVTVKMDQKPDKAMDMRDNNNLFSDYSTKFSPPEQENNVTSRKPLHTTSEPQCKEPAKLTAQPPESPSLSTAVAVSCDEAGQYESARMVGEIFSTYILLENKDKFLIIDKHAAHERILFNRIKTEQADQFSQTLLSPQAVLLSRDEYAVAIEHKDVLAQCGFEIEDFGGGSVLVRSAPMWLVSSDVSVVVSELCSNLKSHKHDITPEFLDDLYHSVACRTAVKGGNKNGELELSAIIKLLEEDPSIQHCPHGRPVCVTMSRYELEKQFGRV
ncbi:DNA mismatch repair endonuclease MutL [Hydrogenoanaerobacterium sp.]|uniref:DNA mismatch repair endonuclease MutL n=1 Tax=Hydrogenoanaerobacterium sp. TaxID=2953763 RepID=UPI0028A1CE1F|nr:DNA mismatch repair endonuclease MutL [Hydrogenoanaerobacterium sp.]